MLLLRFGVWLVNKADTGGWIEVEEWCFIGSQDRRIAGSKGKRALSDESPRLPVSAVLPIYQIGRRRDRGETVSDE